MICSVHGCGRQVSRRGMCSTHYQRTLNGLPVGGEISSGRSMLDRFLQKLSKDLATGCVEWTGAATRAGYGVIRDEQSKMKMAHRVSWTLSNGPIPNGLLVLHRCDNPPCCNPDHLFLGTSADNAADRDRKGRAAWSKITHCPKGHPYSGHNLLVESNRKRKCRECHATRERSRRAANRDDYNAMARQYKRKRQTAAMRAAKVRP